MLWLVAGTFAVPAFFVALLWHLHLQSMEDTIRVRHRMHEEHVCVVGLTTVVAYMVECAGILISSAVAAVGLLFILPGNPSFWSLFGALLGGAVVGAAAGALASWVIVELIARVGIHLVRWIDAHCAEEPRRTSNPRSS